MLKQHKIEKIKCTLELISWNLESEWHKSDALEKISEGISEINCPIIGWPDVNSLVLCDMMWQWLRKLNFIKMAKKN